jgi:2-keto-4-pentenoate hydratase/2-oxohepta-3-ene-1,7-dioic acid hydratase in catechol pathway
MKYIRFISKDNFVRTGILDRDQTVHLLEGSLLGDHRQTRETCRPEDIKQYLTPVDIPAIIALGGNYADHAKECKDNVPDKPLVFLKAITSLTGHQSPIILPVEAPSEVDYEAELGVVIGKRAKNVKPAEAQDYIFGYTCVNDVSARDCQIRLDKQWARGKSFDTFAPVGPVIETELDAADCRVRLFLNGRCMQDATTKDLVFSVLQIVSYLSRNMTLLPGTLILTGTPAGVGFARNPQAFLKPGDQVRVEIDGIGTLENPVIAEQK